MKVRKDFVTNSSSSSFIISKDSVSSDKLLEILFEIANEEAKCRGWEEYIWDEDVTVYGVGHYHIQEATSEDPCEVYTGWGYDTQVNEYNNHFIIDNDSCSRYNWDVIQKILDKYNIPWEYGECD